MLPSQLGRGALLRAEEGLRVLACESVEALAVKFGLRASAGVFCVWVRWRGGRGRCARRARGGGASLRQLLQRGVAFLLCAPPRARKLQRFCAARAELSLMLLYAKSLCQRDAARCGNQLCFQRSLAEVESPSLAKYQGFSSKRHARIGGGVFTGSWSPLSGGSS